MEHNPNEKNISTDFSFLTHHNVQSHFADLNIALLGGRHIQTGEGYLFTLINSYSSEFKNFYRSLYALELTKGRVENIDYYYLDFPEEGKGKLNTSERFREMSPWETIIGLMLLNLYYDRTFEMTKVISWPIIVREIMESDMTVLYKKALFNNTVREHYTDSEWKNFRDIFKRILRVFDRWGWVKIHPSEGSDEDPIFEIRDSIDRFGKLYNYEITQFEHFIGQINKKRNQ